MKLSICVSFLLAGLSSAALAQGGGGAGSGAGAGAAGASAGSPAGAGGTSQSAPSPAGPSQFSDPLNRRGTNAADFSATTGSGSANQPGRGVGTAPNGLPIGATGSGPGSPEQPINSGTRPPQ